LPRTLPPPPLLLLLLSFLHTQTTESVHLPVARYNETLRSNNTLRKYLFASVIVVIRLHNNILNINAYSKENDYYYYYYY